MQPSIFQNKKQGPESRRDGMNNSQKRWDIEKKSGGADDNVIVPVISLRRVNAQNFPEGPKQDIVGEWPKIQDEQLRRDMLDYS